VSTVQTQTNVKPVTQAKGQTTTSTTKHTGEEIKTASQLNFKKSQPPPGLPMVSTTPVISSPSNISVLLRPKAMVQLFGYGNQSSIEISLLGIVERDGTKFVITEFFLPKQTGSSASTEIDEDKLEDVYSMLMKEGRAEDLGKLKCWAHTHPRMGVNWSETDHRMCRTFIVDWFVSIVFNEKYEMRCRVDFKVDGIIFTVDNLPVYLEYASEETMKSLKENLDENVGTGFRTGVGFTSQNYESSYYTSPHNSNWNRTHTSAAKGIEVDGNKKSDDNGSDTDSIDVLDFDRTTWPSGWDTLAVRIFRELAKKNFKPNDLNLGETCLICESPAHKTTDCTCFDCLSDGGAACTGCPFASSSLYASDKEFLSVIAEYVEVDKDLMAYEAKQGKTVSGGKKGKKGGKKGCKKDDVDQNEEEKEDDSEMAIITLPADTSADDTSDDSDLALCPHCNVWHSKGEECTPSMKRLVLVQGDKRG